MQANQWVSIGWSDLGDLSSVDLRSKKEILARFESAGAYPYDKKTASRKAGEIINFIIDIQIGDVVLAQQGSDVLGIGIVSDDYTYEDSQDFPHIRPVEWKVVAPTEFSNMEGLRTTVYPITDDKTIRKIEELMQTPNTFSSNMLPNQSQQPDKHPLNQILYGPPGTGKTYNSIDKAVEIIKGSSSSHDENKQEFDALRKAGQIEFVTFHQNYSYEDFMIGIRPDLDEASTLKFKRSEGIFYKLCKRAEQNYLQAKNKTERLKPFQEVFSEFIEPLEKEDREVEVRMTSGKASFWITDINANRLGFRKQSGGTAHTLSLDTIKELYEGSREFTSGLRYYYMPLLHELWKKGKQADQTVHLKNFIIIIDEINRANMSRVFGELITLLEEDKRIGAKNELRVTLPNNEKDFGIPPNVYLIGTMNTADKSIALVDIALRRRFEFVGYFPDYDVLDRGEDKLLLQHINREVFKRKKSADFLIGHAYFIGETNSAKVLTKKVIPLLMEYFSGKTQQVEEIFKDSLWDVRYDEERFCWELKAVN